jgi:hypothetical protein
LHRFHPETGLTLYTLYHGKIAKQNFFPPAFSYDSWRYPMNIAMDMHGMEGYGVARTSQAYTGFSLIAGIDSLKISSTWTATPA